MTISVENSDKANLTYTASKNSSNKMYEDVCRLEEKLIKTTSRKIRHKDREEILGDKNQSKRPTRP